jgi:hypothetical protein
MAQEIGQTSQYFPTVVFDGLTDYHMVFTSRDSTDRVLYATSGDGQNWNFVGDVDGQTTGSAPALALYVQDVLAGTPTRLLVAVFVSNDSSKRILYAILDLNSDPNTRGWKFVGQVAKESAHWVFALGTQSASSVVTVYFLSNDNTNRLLEVQFTPNA